ncbi:unnamed protein product [Clonostachys solani]|uniref:Zinc finger PHD-type domain-containing protein n=1 Tax=Clonostachys solani TaxID=160281 RepID=A0A9N9VV65_9HYPO|nr:unnamed protein product [Clonostachys solani]
MAPPSPRRSSRARATTSQSHHSSSSSSASGRAERNARSLNKTPSTKSTPSASLSSEPLDDPEDTLLGRRRKRGQEDDPDKPVGPDTLDMANGSDGILDEEDEAVRCPCGSEEYPGRPLVDSPDAEFFDAIEFTEDVTGFFVQCDICKVWQHGACVGIFSAESSPDEYFCEQCRKDLHKIYIANNGQKYSKYVPLYRQSRPSSRAASVTKDPLRSPKNGTKTLRPNSASQNSKRRSTMNSRDAAYDDEQLRRAIEASKEENPLDSEDASLRRTKRGRSDSEEHAPSVKRQRTGSKSESPIPEPAEEPTIEPSDDEGQLRNGTKKPRVVRNQKERSDKDEKERQRLEAASKRKGRAERRRAEGKNLQKDIINERRKRLTNSEDSEPSDDIPTTITTSKVQPKKEEEIPVVEETPPAPQPTPGTPPTSHATVGSSHKRGARNNHKKGKGKNQYTKDRDGDRDDSPARSMSRDIQKNADETPSQATKAHSHESKASKHKSAMANKMSMLDMRRRVAAIMDFISRTQVDLAAEGSLGSSSNSSSGDRSPEKSQTNGNTDRSGIVVDRSALMTSEQEFRDLNCVEMMDILTRDMVKWQNQYT